MVAAREPSTKQADETAGDCRDVQVELTLLTFQNVIRSTALSTVGVVGVHAFLAVEFKDIFLWELVLSMLVIGAARLGTIFAFSHRTLKHLTADRALHWEMIFGALTFLHCAALAVSTLYNYARHDTATQGLCTMGSFALCAGLSSRTITRPQIALPSGFLLLGALAFSMLRWQKTFSQAGAVIICFFAYAYIESVRNKFAMVVQQLRNKRELRELAEQDPLTGLPNRRHFSRKLEALCLESMPFSVLYIDLDGFKQVNDLHGHRMGDLLLQDVANRLRSSIRCADLLARLGGDEFAILQTPQGLPDPPQALAVRINCAMARPFVLDGKEICISASVGIQSAASIEAHALAIRLSCLARPMLLCTA